MKFTLQFVFEYQIFESKLSYLKCIDPICKAELSLIDCFVKSLGLQSTFLSNAWQCFNRDLILFSVL